MKYFLDVWYSHQSGVRSKERVSERSKAYLLYSLT